MKLLKPRMERVASGDFASVQAVITVNAEQAPKRRMQEPTHRSYGEGRRRWMTPSERVPSDLPGYLATACRHRGSDATRETPAVIARGINWRLARDRPGRAG